MATITCAACGCPEHAELVDAKPPDGDWEGGDYTRFECIGCYGPGWEPMAETSLAKSVCDHLRPHYDAWLERRLIRQLAAGALNDHAGRFTPKHFTASFHPHPVSLCA